MNQANSRNGFVHDDSTTNIVVVVINDALTHWFGTVQDVKEELSESESSEAEESESPAADVSRKRRRVEIEYELETEQPTTSRLKLWQNKTPGTRLKKISYDTLSHHCAHPLCLCSHGLGRGFSVFGGLGPLQQKY